MNGIFRFFTRLRDLFLVILIVVTGVLLFQANIPGHNFDDNNPNIEQPTRESFSHFRHSQTPMPSIVTINDFDTKGELVQILVNNVLTAGEYEITVDASALPSGVYFYSLNTEDFTSTKKMILVK